jgi:hypothetical protein
VQRAEDEETRVMLTISDRAQPPDEMRADGRANAL